MRSKKSRGPLVTSGYQLNRDISEFNMQAAGLDSEEGAEKGQQTSFCAYITAERSHQRTPDKADNEQTRKHEINIIQLVFKSEEHAANSPGRQTESQHEVDNNLANKLEPYSSLE